MTESIILDQVGEIMEELGQRPFKISPITLNIPAKTPIALDLFGIQVFVPANKLPENVTITSQWGRCGGDDLLQIYQHSGRIILLNDNQTYEKVYLIRAIPTMRSHGSL